MRAWRHLQVVFLLIALLCVLLIPAACSCEGDSADTSNVNADDDSSFLDDDDSTDDDFLDDDADDDTVDDDSDDDADDDAAEILPCPNGFTIPQGHAGAGGCITQLDGGAPGHDGTSIAIGLDGTRHVALAKGREIIVYSLPADAAPDEPWTQELIALMGAQPKIAVDADGNRHLVWHDIWYGSLKYATDASGTWEIETADDGDGQNVGAEPAIDIDPDGFAHVSYQLTSPTELHVDGVKYATNRSGEWVTELVDGAPWGRCTDVAADSNGTAYVLYSNEICYLCGAFQYLRSNAGGTWQEILGVSNGWCGEVHVAEDDSLRIVPGHDNVGYLTNEYGFWWPKTQPVNGEEMTGDFSNDGNAHIAWQYRPNVGSASLYYSANETGTWVNELVHDGDNWGNLSLVVNAVNNPQIVASANPARLLTLVDSTWDSIVIDDTLRASDASLVLDAFERPRIAYYYHGAVNGLVKYSLLDADGIWHTTNLTDDNAWFDKQALALNSANESWVVYYDSGSGNLKVGSEANEWAFENLPTPPKGHFGAGLIAIDDNDSIFIAAKTNFAVYMISNETGAWVLDEALDDDPRIASVAIDASGEPVMVLADYNMYGPLFLRRVAPGNWKIKNIDNVFVKFASMAVRDDGVINVAYIDDSSDLIRFASNAWSGLWSIEEIEAPRFPDPLLDPQKYYARDISLTLDSDEQPLIFFGNTYQGLNSAVSVAKKVDGDWSIERIDIGGQIGIIAGELSAYPITGESPSIVWDQNGIAHATYDSKGALVYSKFVIE